MYTIGIIDYLNYTTLRKLFKFYWL